MSYIQFQFIALETPTLDPVKPVDMSKTDYVQTVAKEAGIDVSGLCEDAKNRLNWIREAVDEALQYGKLGGNNTLKIFAAPEFFFRPELPIEQEVNLNASVEKKLNQEAKVVADRSYQGKDAKLIHDLFEHLFRDKSLKDWLIIPGTVLGHMNPNDAASKTPNRAYVIQGGPPEDGQKAIRTRYNKFNTADGDKIPLKLIWEVTPNKQPLKKRTDLYDYQVTTIKEAESNIINVGSYRIGIEICMDHTYQLLYRTCVLRGKRAQKPAEGVHLQILVACGRTFRAESLATVPGGFVLRVDGMPSAPRSQVLRGLKVDWEEYNQSQFEPPKATSEDSSVEAKEAEAKLWAEKLKNVPASEEGNHYLGFEQTKRKVQPTLNAQIKLTEDYEERLRYYSIEPFPKNNNQH